LLCVAVFVTLYFFTENSEIKLRESYISKGFYVPDVGSKFADHFYKPLSTPVQNANLELAMLSMVAGSVIALVAVILCFTFCSRKMVQ